MRYCSLPDLQLAIPPQTLVWLSNDDESATAMNAAVVEEAVRQAEELVEQSWVDGFHFIRAKITEKMV